MANGSVRYVPVGMAPEATAGSRLPRGPHRLTREQVVQSQRGRIFRAMAEVMVRDGYAKTSVAEVLRAARVSRETFYEQFSSKEDCFMAAFEAAVEAVLTAVRDAPAPAGSALERFRHGLRAYLDALADDPAFARVMLIEVYAAGTAAMRRRAALQQRFVEAVDETLGGSTSGDRFANEALVAATSAMVTARLAHGDVDGLRALHRPLTELARRLHP
jgi:AcrR family transcriptional regulator